MIIICRNKLCSRCRKKSPEEQQQEQEQQEQEQPYQQTHM